MTSHTHTSGHAARRSRRSAFAIAAGLAAVATAALATPAAAGPFEDGERAYLQQDYRKAHRLLEPLARKGNSQAQYLLGRQYQFGQGVKKSKVRAYYWYRRAEKGGHVEAGLFRHLLVSKWKMTKAEVAQAEKLLAGRPSSLAAASTVTPNPTKTPVAAKTAKTRATQTAKPNAQARKKPKRAAKVRTAVRRPVRVQGRAASQQRRTRKPYATAVIRPYPPNRPAGTGWRRAPANDCYDCTGTYRPRYQPNYRPSYRNDYVPVRPYPVRPYPVRPYRYRRWPGPAARRYLYQLPRWQRRQLIRRHRWRVRNDPFYRRAWRAYRRYGWQRRW